MNLLHTINWLYSLSGFGVGVLVGMTGVGGGSLMTPLLILLFGIHPATAVGTDLLYAAITKSGGTLIHGMHRTIDWRVVGRLALGSVPMTALTLLLLSKLNIDPKASGHLIETVLGCALYFTALTLIFRAKILAFYASRIGEIDPRHTVLFTVLTGAVLGILVSLSSVGAGALGVTVLILLYPNLSTLRIVGSDIAHAVPLTLVAGLGHWIMGDVNTTLLFSLLLGSLPGIVIGSTMSIRIPDHILRMVLAVTLALVATKLLF